jgi:hypothetical protein
MKFVRTSVCIVFLACSAIAAADDSATPVVEEDEIEEIIVYGGRTLVGLRLDIYRAEDDFYELYNSLNSDDEFDVRCFKRAPTGSHIRKRVCQAEFVSAIYAEASQNFRVGFVDTISYGQIQRKDKKMRKEMEELAATNAAFAAALAAISAATERYESEKRRRCDGRTICW